MNKFCIIANTDKELSEEYAYKIDEYLKSKGCTTDIIFVRSIEPYNKTICDDADCVIVLGGDGTLIQAAKEVGARDIPLYGINFGGVGFLTDSDAECMWDDIDNLIEGRFVVERRMMLSGTVRRANGSEDEKVCTLNDFHISKREFGKLIQFEVYINGVLLDKFRADGVILSSPTGSTGYNLSAGGPVIAPEVEAIVVTPICPLSMNDRSFVIGGHDRIDIKLLEGKHVNMDSAIIYADGNVLTKIKSGDMIHIEKADMDTGIILMEKTNFYHKMRIKLITGGQI